MKSLLCFDNEGLLVLNKPYGIPSQNDKTGDDSLQSKAYHLVKGSIHLLSRLDRPVSGLLLATTNPKRYKSYGQRCEKRYIAVTSKTEVKEASLEGYLKKDGKRMKARLSNEEKPGYKYVSLTYRVVLELDNYDVIEVIPATGRFHQIRAQLASVGRHIKGDVKYGAKRGNRDRSIGLHSYFIGLSDKVNIQVRSNRESGIWKEVDKWLVTQINEFTVNNEG